MAQKLPGVTRRCHAIIWVLRAYKQIEGDDIKSNGIWFVSSIRYGCHVSISAVSLNQNYAKRGVLFCMPEYSKQAHGSEYSSRIIVRCLYQKGVLLAAIIPPFYSGH